MVQKTVDMGDDEPRQNEKPSEDTEHLFKVMNIFDSDDPTVIPVQLAVTGGEEDGRTMLHRVSLDDTWKGFFVTRLFLKAIGEQYKGNDIKIDSDNWIGRSFHAVVIHNKATSGKVYANIDTYNFNKMVEKAWDE